VTSLQKKINLFLLAGNRLFRESLAHILRSTNDRCSSAPFTSFIAGRFPLPNFKTKTQMGLTRREQQLVLRMAQGFTNREIASHLDLSEQSVKNHIHRILERMGASDRLAGVEIVREQRAESSGLGLAAPHWC
jgi:DNA-binding NarL/FixJ family response regulator